MSINDSIYSDLDFKWRRVSSTKDVNAVIDEAAINQSIFSLFNTRAGERFFNLTYGTAINNLLFEPLDTLTAKLLSEEMVRVINREEGGRIKLTELNITVDYDNALYSIYLSYSILSTDKTGQLNLTFRKI